MSLHKYALIRYRIIDSMLRNKYRPYPTIEELRSKCEEHLFVSTSEEHISISTIEKDLRAMREDTELGYEAPIKYSRAHRGYHYTDPDYTIQNIPLNNDDVDAIKLAANTLFNFRESPLFAQFRFAIEKIFDRLNIAKEVQDERIDQVVQFDSYPEYPGNEFLSALYQSIIERRAIKLKYQKFGSDAESDRFLHPYLLKEYGYRWYLIAFQPSSDKVLTFALDRIKEVEVTTEYFAVRSDFDADRFFQYSFGITQKEEQPIDITLRFPLNQLGYLLTSPLHPAQKIEKHRDHFDLSLRLVPSFELFEKLLSFGDRVKVIAPSSIQKELLMTYEKAAAQYGNEK